MPVDDAAELTMYAIFYQIKYFVCSYSCILLNKCKKQKSIKLNFRTFYDFIFLKMVLKIALLV